MAVSSRLSILLVEDNPGDVALISQALEESDIHPELYRVADGVEAMQFLNRQSPFEQAVKPSIIILDINLPRKNGRDVLAEIKSDPALMQIPVIVFSSSDDPRDVSACYALHANCYLIKPKDLPGMTEIIHGLVDFWLRKVKLPPDPDSSFSGIGT